MFGTTLATAPIMSSNFIGTRVYTLGVYSDVLVEDLFPFTQNHIVSGFGLLLANTFVLDTAITQLHLFDDVPNVYEPIVDSGTLHQNHIVVPLGEYLNAYFVEDTTISQNHIISANAVFSQPITSDAFIIQSHLLGEANLLLKYSVTDVNMQQAHLMSGTGLSANTSVAIGSFGQNHVVIGISLTLGQVDVPEADFTQLHKFVPDYLKLEPVEVGKPYVNPSIRRVVYATGDSTNMMVITVEENNYALLLNPSTNKYS